MGFLVYFLYRMRFEYDPAKSESNRAGHGIDFEEAKQLWEDDDRILFPAKSGSEERYALLGKRGGKVRAAFFTMRGEVTRIISVRRARENEEKIYQDG
jgi:uncharacterized DUF497 family protein